jgi:hypothetical protein
MQSIINPHPSVLSSSHQDNTTESTPTMRNKNKGENKNAMTGGQTPDNKAGSNLKNKESEFHTIHRLP